MGKLLVLLLIGPLVSVAQTLRDLEPFPPTPTFSFDPTAEPSLPSCSQILSRMNRLQEITNESHLALIDFMSGSARIVQDWHEDLQPLEGRTVTIKNGQFEPLAIGAEQILELSDLGYQNADYIFIEMGRIAQALAKCLPQQGVPSGLSQHH